jgi:hypothetical protein
MNSACVVVPDRTWQCMSLSCQFTAMQDFIALHVPSQSAMDLKSWVRSRSESLSVAALTAMAGWQSQLVPGGGGAGGGVGAGFGAGGGGGGIGGSGGSGGSGCLVRGVMGGVTYSSVPL